jgi:hypothetical protein
MIFGQDRTELRRLFVEAWRRRVDQLPVEPLHDQIATVIALHPEYHALVEGPAALERDWTPADGETNPFLHMGMHLALREQVATDRPAGIRAAFQRLTERLGDPHAAEHEAFECLGRALWEAQRAGRPPDEAAYLECIRQRAGSA